MSAASDYLEKEVLDHVLGEGARDFTSPATLYIALFTGDTQLETNNPTLEVSGNNYSRTAVSFNAAASGSATNDGAVTFPTASGGNFGTITHVAVVDHASNTNWGTGVNVLFYGALSVDKTVTDGDTFQISDQQLTISLA